MRSARARRLVASGGAGFGATMLATLDELEDALDALNLSRLWTTHSELSQEMDRLRQPARLLHDRIQRSRAQWRRVFTDYESSNCEAYQIHFWNRG